MLFVKIYSLAFLIWVCLNNPSLLIIQIFVTWVRYQGVIEELPRYLFRDFTAESADRTCLRVGRRKLCDFNVCSGDHAGDTCIC